MIHWKIGVVKFIKSGDAISEEHSSNLSLGSMQELEVQLDDGTAAAAVHYRDTLPDVQVGDTVLLNTTAVELRLGSGGVHFVHAILSKNSESKLYLGKESKGHLMKLKYTSLQRKVLAAEEQMSGHQAVFHKDNRLDQIPVLIGELHSMLPIAALWLNRMKIKGRPCRIVYIMTDGGALPLAWSKHVLQLQKAKLLSGTVTYGQAYGGDIETINKFTALLAARHILQADVILVAMGPGIAGTGTDLGHSSMEVGELINAVSILGGTPILIPRISFAEARPRHYGISHHTLTALNVTALRPALIPLPANFPASYSHVINEQLDQASIRSRHQICYLNQITIAEVMEVCSVYPIPLTTMGRQVHEDPYFFLSVCCAAQAAADCMLQIAKNQPKS